MALAGFPLLATAQLCFVVVPVLAVLAVLPGSVAARIGLPLCIATVGALAYATRQALHIRRSEPAGVPVTRADAPRLWAVIDEAARAAGTRAPASVTVVAEAAATVSERARLFGFMAGRRDLYLGLPLLQAWDVAHLRALLAHEIGHGSPAGGRLAPLAYRGRTAVARTIPRISRRNPAGLILLAYAWVYRRVDTPFSRAQELAADRRAAEFASPAAMAGVLLDLPVLDAAQRLFYAEYLGPGWQAGHVPDDIFGGYLRVLAARADELAIVREQAPAVAPSRWDPHPPVPDRLAALAALPVPGQAAEPSAAESLEELVPDLPGLGRALQAVVFPPQGRTRVGWDEFFGAARTVELQRDVDAALATLSEAAGTPITNAGEVLDLAADGRLLKAAEQVFPELSPARTAEQVSELIKLLLALAALRSGATRWRHSWTGTAELVAPDGSQLDLGELAAMAAAPETVAAARERLAHLGIDLTAAGQVGTTRTAASAGVVGGLVNLVVDGSRVDLLLVDTGLFLVPGLPRSHNGAAKRRLVEFAAADDTQRRALAPGCRFVPYADVAAATQTRRTPKTWDFALRDGRTVTLRTSLDSDELPGGWAVLDDAVSFLARERRPAAR
ncbi:MAG TPA: M48 family metalloprotease [Actinoplanes sp.]|nr:M48 family metalloprotease [Actinoplanes sp.]